MRVTEYLAADHQRLHEFLARAATGTFDAEAFERFRGGLLRHIGIEEKLLFPEVRRRGGGAPEALLRLRVEHAALAALLVPTPDATLAAEIEALLVVHDAREDATGGVYASCEAILGEASAALADAAQQFPTVRTARHFDGNGVHRTAREAIASAEQSMARRRKRAAPSPPGGREI